MLSQYGFVLILSGIALLIPVAATLIGHFLGPRRPDPIKNETYESGVETIGDTWVQFRAQYYLIGLIFLIFDVEVIFLVPHRHCLPEPDDVLGAGGDYLCCDSDPGSVPRMAQGRARVGLTGEQLCTDPHVDFGGRTLMNWSDVLIDLQMRLGAPEQLRWLVEAITYFIGAFILVNACARAGAAVDLDHAQGREPHPGPHRSQPPWAPMASSRRWPTRSSCCPRKISRRQALISHAYALAPISGRVSGADVAGCDHLWSRL